MKRVMSRSYLVLLVALAFFTGFMFLTFRIATQSTDWIQQPYNGHMSATDGLSGAGNITDRNGVKLAYNDDSDKRCYNDDQSIREALLHVVGDSSLNISTAVQSMYRTQLTGYNFIFGLGMPKSIKTNNDVQLTIDANACKAAYDAMDGHKGACVIYNYKTGEVLVDVSNPTYDPADPPEITSDNEAEYDGVYLDNVVSSTFTPGSTFKIVTAACAIENIKDIDSRTFTCNGEYEVLGKNITCEDAHGDISFDEAFSHSCNCAFAQMAIELGEEKLKKTAEELGFNNKSFTMSGIPLAPSYYDAKGAGDNYLAWSGIGQYKDLANPMHMAMMCGSIANGGRATAPFIIRDDGDLLSKLNLKSNKGSDVNMLPSDVSERVAELMRHAGERYSYNGISLGGLDFCAKTGTAEIHEGEAPTGWFVGYCEDAEHPYAFAVVLVESDYGFSAAAPVAEAAIGVLVNGSE